jgi:hypothetical protein
MWASILVCASKVYDWKTESSQYQPFIPSGVFQYSALLIYSDKDGLDNRGISARFLSGARGIFLLHSI